MTYRCIRIRLSREVGLERENVISGRPMPFASANRVLMHWGLDALDNPFPVRYEIEWINGVRVRGQLTLHHHTQATQPPNLSKELAEIYGRYQTDDD